MANFFQRVKRKIISSLRKNKKEPAKVNQIDEKITLGLLLWTAGSLAEADGKFLPQEEEEIKTVLREHLKVSDEDFPIVLAAIRQAAWEKIDFYQFADEVSKDFTYVAKISLLEDLFRIAWADRKISEAERALIHKVAAAFAVREEDFSALREKVQKEFNP
jgi:uncharacterized tellurite resistance protein B-like protein